MEDAIRFGVVSHAEMVAQLTGKFFGGTAMDDTMRKYVDTLVTVNRPDTVALSNEAT